MIRTSVRIISFIASASLLFTCDNYEFPKSPYPRIETLSVAKVTENGVTLRANITQLGRLQIINHGFIWGLTENLSIQSEDKIQLGNTSDVGDFEVDIKSGLYEGEVYYVKAFVATAEYFVYGDVISFTSKGSMAPEIKSFSPAEGTWGDTVTIKGNYFSGIAKNNLVKFGSFESKVATSNDSIIKCIVPGNISTKTIPISVTVAGNQTQSSTNFILASPVIQNFSPQTATFDDIITITGSHFSSTKVQNIVKFNDKIAEVVEATRTQLKVKVPSTILTKENIISVTVSLQSGNADGVFMISPPSVNSISNTQGSIGSIIQIHGNNFNPLKSGNIVSLSGTPATILNSTKSTLTIELPQGIYKNRSFEIEVITAQQSAFSTQLFTLQDPWIKKADVPHGRFGRYDAVAFSIGGLGYVGLGSGEVENKFWQYNPVENSWKEVAPFPGGQRAGATCFVIDDMAYVGLGGGASNDFWRYNPQTNSWTRIADFPYESYQARGYTINGKGYVVRKAETDNFWEYDPTVDTWTLLPSFPTGDFSAYPQVPESGFVIDDRLFIYSADYTTGPNYLWEFDFANQQWLSLSSPEDNDYLINDWTTGFSVKGKGYIRGDLYLYKYTVSTNSWITSVDGVPGARQLSIAFVINGKAYFGTSFSGAYDLWEFDPDFE